MNKQPPHPQPGSESAAEALDNTTRPMPTEDGDGDSDRLGPTADSIDSEDVSLRELKPRSIERQWGSTPDIKPEGDQKEGVKEWIEQSPEMNESFPDQKTG